MDMVMEHGHKHEQQEDISLQVDGTGVLGLVNLNRGVILRQVHCDGCGFAESADLPMSKKKIKDITLETTEDKRFPEGKHKYTADLCPSCISLLLHSYFNVPAENRLELAVPSFLEPQSLRA
jgi:hypothetical protein